MPTDKIDLKRDFYPLQEAAELAGLKADDLIHMAAQGKLTVSVLADNWEIGAVYEIERSPDFEGDLTKVSYVGPGPIEFPEPGDEEFHAKFEAWKQNKDKKDIVVGRHRVYGRQGPFAYFYSLLFRGPQPISKVSFADYLVSPSTATIRIDLNRILGVSELDKERLVMPERPVGIQDAVADKKLIVLKSDLNRLISGDKDSPDDVKADGGVTRKTLLKLVIGLADKGYNYDPSSKKNAAVGDIHRDLQRAGVGLDEDSIRKALREAASLLPRKPQKD